MLQNAIVLTGGIASGKSTVSALMRLYGFHIIDADKVAHAVLDANAGEIATLFGDEYIVQNRVDRKKLGTLVFANKKKRLELEALVHPKIKEQILQQAYTQEKFGKPYFIDIPLFFEREGAYEVERVLVVYTPKEIQLERLIKREGLSEQEATQRIESQLPIESKREKATYLIYNDRDLKHLQNECERVKEEILQCM